MWFANIFPQPVGCIFTLLMMFFKAQKFFIFDEVQLIYFVACVFVVKLELYRRPIYVFPPHWEWLGLLSLSSGITSNGSLAHCVKKASEANSTITRE